MSNILFKVNFFSRTALQFFLLTNWIIVVFFDLPMRWQSLISFVLILTSIWSKILITFPSNWSSETLSRTPYIFRLLCLLYWFCLSGSGCNTEIGLFSFSIFRWSFEFFFTECYNDGVFILRETFSNQIVQISFKTWFNGR